MALSLVTAAAAEPLTLTEAKLHLRVDHSTDDDLITALIKASREYCENFTRRAIPSQTFDLKLDGFPDLIELPMPPVTAITSITYVDANGDTQTLSSSLYRTDLPSGPKAQRARIEPAYGQVWPSTRAVVNAVTVRFVAGYSTYPGSILAAMKLLIGHWYEQREAVSVSIGANVQTVPIAVDSLLWPYKAY
jgi:uncharacterized phiE125 gp8 family phage protein